MPTSPPVPCVFRFLTPLTQDEAEMLIRRLFEGREPPLWGDPMRLGPMKWHVYGCDRVLWKNANLEITETGIIAIFPEMSAQLGDRLRGILSAMHPLRSDEPQA